MSEYSSLVSGFPLAFTLRLSYQTKILQHRSSSVSLNAMAVILSPMQVEG
jgi:hypothetical protein